MSRLSTPSLPTRVLVNLDPLDLTCAITQSLFFDPVAGCNTDATCGHLFENRECAGELSRCPLCREEITFFSPVVYVKNRLDQVLLANPELWQEVYFNLDHFAEVCAQEQQNEFKKPIWFRFIRLLENAHNHLNDKAIEGKQIGKSAIEILARYPQGRDLLQRNTKIRALISATSLKIHIEGKSILEWMTPFFQLTKKERQLVESMMTEQTTIFDTFSRAKYSLFKEAKKSLSARSSHVAVNALLQEVVNAQRSTVREILDRMKRDNPALLQTVLRSVSTIPIIDFSGKKIENKTLLQSAASVGDVSLHPELIASDPNHEGMYEIIQSFMKDALGESEVATQLQEIFPEGIKRLQLEQKRTFFNFEAILTAIHHAPTDQVDTAYILIGAQFFETNSARGKKDNDTTLTLTDKLNRFREQFTKKSMADERFNPYDLLQALQLYKTLEDDWGRDGSDLYHKKRTLFWRQVICFAQRFLPPCYVQCLVQGLCHLIKMNQGDAWRPEVLKNAYEKSGNCFYPLSNTCMGIGFDYGVGFIVGDRDKNLVNLFEKLVSIKNSRLEKIAKVTPAYAHNHAHLVAIQ